MGISIRLPNINADRPNEQIQQMRSYLYSFAQELQWALNTIEAGSTSTQEIVLQAAANKSTQDSVQIFNDIKSLIIKSADIVSAYYEKIDSLIETSGKYTAASAFGTYQQQTNMSIGATDRLVQQNISSVQNITDLVNGMADRMTANESYIRYGAVGTSLDDTEVAADTAPGIEIGDYTRTSDGSVETTNRRYARFTAYGLELFGESLTAAPVAYIKQSKLYITNAEITSTLRLGGYLISRADGLSFDWVGG